MIMDLSVAISVILLVTCCCAIRVDDDDWPLEGKGEVNRVFRRQSGEPGPKGDPGPPGPQGEHGRSGLPGLAGPLGPAGTTGDVGPVGLNGDAGQKGDIGVTGEKGEKGESGRGDKGEKGQPGESGPQGPPGTDGRDGNDGVRGPQGVPGNDGVQGAPGPRGVPGRQGKPGLDCVTGKTGLPGNDGKPGEHGSIGPKGDPGPQGSGSGGGIYIRWGRTTCPNITGTEMVYRGRAAGSHHTNRGGGSNFQCLTEDPENFDYGPTSARASYIYGAEYETVGNVPLSSLPLQNHNVPCTVCYVTTRATVLMIPGKYTCPENWTREYYGYLMSERHNHYRSTFECVDAAPEGVPGGEGNENGALFYHVEPRHGSLPFPPYQAEKEITCVVCTR